MRGGNLRSHLRLGLGFVLQQLAIKRTIRNVLKVLQSNTFKTFLGLGVSAKPCNMIGDSYT